MARKSGSIFERHIEKAVFGITALVLLFVAFNYLLFSPNVVTIGDQTVGPAKVDLVVEQKAKEVLARVRDAEPEEIEVQAAPITRPPEYAPSTLARAVAWREPVLDVGDVSRGVGSRSITLASVGAPDRPVIRSGRNLVQKNLMGYPELGSANFGSSTFRMAPTPMPSMPMPSAPTVSGGGRGGGHRGDRGSGHRGDRGSGHQGARESAPQPVRAPMVTRRPTMPTQPQTFAGGLGAVNPLAREDVDWVSVYFTFNLDEQRERFKKAGYSLARQEAVFVWPRIQRRALRDGKWTDWEEVRTFEPYRRIPIPSVETTADGYPTPMAMTNVQIFGDTMRAFQPEVMRPGFLDLVSGTRWDIPKLPGIETSLFDAEGDNRFPHILARWDPNYQPPDDGTGDGRPWWEVMEERRQKDMEEQRRQERLNRQLANATPQEAARIEAAADMEEAEKLFEKGDLVGARSLADKTLATELAPMGFKNQADELLTKIYEKLLEQREEEIAKLAAQTRQDEQAGILAQFGVDATSLTRPPVTMLWAHDLTVRPGSTYQYRTQVRLLNVFAGQPDRFKDANDAKTAVIEGAWSEPSEIVNVDPDMHFFLAQASEANRNVRLRLFKWFLGQWVRDDFTAEIGDSIGGVSKVRVGEIDEARASRKEVDFSSDYTVVDLDFDRPLPESGVSTNGVSMNGFGGVSRPKTTVAMVYLDAQNELHERLLAVDRDNDLRRSLDDQVFKPPPPLPTEERRINQRTVRPGQNRGNISRTGRGSGHGGGSSRGSRRGGRGSGHQ